MCFKDDQLSLFGQHSIVGRSVVVHANEDDMGKKGD
jgi:Cu-Zn family superoxide dismutase